MMRNIATAILVTTLTAAALSSAAVAPVQAAAPAPGAFTAVTPSRLLDTRDGDTVEAGAAVSFPVAGVGEVPAGAAAVVLNVTVTGAAAGGFVTAYPAGTVRPSASNLNFVAGQTIANHVTVKLGTGASLGKVSLYNGSGGSVDLLADVAGWYASGTATANGTFTPITPTRLLDTRTDDAKVASKDKVPFGVIPATAAAAALNVTVANSSASGFITAFPGGGTQPNVSNLNFATGQTIANAATVKLGTGGKVDLYNGSAGTVNLIADAAGWFKGGAAAVDGAFTPMAPARLLDTRTRTKVPANGSVTVNVGQSNAAAAVLNVTVANPEAGGFITAFPGGTTRPEVSNLNFVAGQAIPNLVTVKVGAGGKVTLYNGSAKPVDLIADIAGWYKGAPATSSLPSGVLNLTNWKITLPTGPQGSPTEIKQPDLNTFQISPYFLVNPDKSGVIFRANAGGTTTSGSSYPRSELREMTNGGKDQASWSNKTGTHTMTITQAITALPKVKPHVVAGQIHDADDDVMMIRLEGQRLFVEADGDEVGLLDANYKLGTFFTVKISATSKGITVLYNTAKTVSLTTTGSGYYFKAGCYTQSNVSKGDLASAYGEVVIKALTVTHQG